MSAALAGNTPATFEIKSASLPLVALLLKSTDLARLAGELAQRYGDMPEFFDHDPLLIDLSPLQPQTDEAVDFPALVQLLQQYRLRPLAVCGGSPAQIALAQRAGLVSTPDAMVQKRGPTTVPASASANRQSPETAPAAAVPVLAHPGALLIDKPLRSGQQVYARGRDLVVMAMVNPGAEVIADGHIHVYAPLRGKAIAGARGNTEARILALAMEPELISIAGVYRTSEKDLPSGIKGKPAQVRLVPGPDGDKLVIDPLSA